MIRQMAIPIALLGFNDLGRSVTPTFLFRSRFYLQLSTLCPKTNKKSMWEVKKAQDFCPRDIESCHLAAARRVKLWSLRDWSKSIGGGLEQRGGRSSVF